MEQWAAVVADILLLAVTLTGGIMTLLRAQQVSRRATLLAAAACLTLIAWMLYQLVWWLITVPAEHSQAEIAAGAGHSSVGILVTGVVISIAVALLFAAVNFGDGEPAGQSSGQPAGQSAGQAAAAPAHGRHVPAQANGHAAHGQHAQHAQRPPAAPAHSGQGAGGWTPPQQAHPNDWNIMSGVWSIPRGTFDGPPPEDPNHRQ